MASPLHTAKNATDFLQVFNFTGFLQLVFSSSICNKFVKMRLVVTCHLQTCCNLFQQLAASFVATSFDSQPATSLTTTCNRPCRRQAVTRDLTIYRTATRRQRRVNWKEMNNYSCKQFIWILDTRFSCCLDRQITYFHVLYTTPTHCIQPVEL